MNDFTKEELEFMLSCMDGEIMYYGTDHVGHGARKKIQSLIDNYCEQCPSAHDFYECLVCDHCGLVGCEDCKQACGGELIDG